ncbi:MULTISPECIES: DoxX family membrane protein [unclassified Actinobaculum]|uniref:DoxX family protein n=1 Tax=unclassified Actinobaculum TaxID=2609299 RepID=UPI000D528FFD|nr:MULTISPECIES: DoxX family membrane protein [unclassified Actinobaculum]AWE42908.1 DoxX family protein [Actinobaculum sp. 313]RTE49007.1 DoxX family membrane protein [Actinobaculum sp. 352]
MSILRLIARPLLASPYVISGADALLRPSKHRERAAVFAPLPEKLGITLDDQHIDMATRVLGLAHVACGTALALGKAQRLAACTLAVTQVPIALANNPFWQHRAEERKEDLSSLAAAAGLIGGTLFAAMDRNGKPSLSWRRAAARAHRSELRAVRSEARERIAAAKRPS